MNNNIKLIENVTFNSLNPHNFHLKNDYINNLLSTAFLILPVIDELIEKVEVRKGFLSRSYVRATIKNVKPYEYQHTIGLAIEVTWSDWSYDSALIVAEKLFSSIEEGLKIIINPKRNTLFIGRGVKKSSIEEDTGRSERVIKINTA